MFLEFQDWLLSEEVQKRLLLLGRRTGLGGDLSQADPQVFRPEWGIDPQRVISTIRLPAGPVIERALELYQTSFRKPSFTALLLDYSGSMAGEGEEQMRQAVRYLLNPDWARRYFLQSGEEDWWLVIAFSGVIKAEFLARGDTQSLRRLLRRLEALEVGGTTNIHAPILRALEIYHDLPDRDRYLPAIVLMTDGEHNTGPSFNQVSKVYRSLGLDVPIFSIQFGEANPAQLTPLAELSRARVFDGRTDLASAFRTVRGYN